MSARRTAIPLSVERLPVDREKKLRDRLTAFVHAKFAGNWARFARVTAIPKQTVEGWKIAGQRWPQMRHLLRLAEHGLSIDWLMTGHGSMERMPTDPQTELGQLIVLFLLPRLRRVHGVDVGELTVQQAFAHILVDPGPEALLDEAARALLPRYREILRDLKRSDERSDFASWVLDRLALVDKESAAANSDGMRTVLAEMKQMFHAYVPDYLDAVVSKEATFREEFEQPQALANEASPQRWSEAALMTATAMRPTVLWATAALEQLVQDPPRADGALMERLRGIVDVLGRLKPQAQALPQSKVRRPKRRDSTGRRHPS